MNKMPTFDRLMNPLIEALRRLGGSGSIDEIYEKVVEIEGIPDDVLSKLHDEGRSSQTRVS
jgi:restriction system protein